MLATLTRPTAPFDAAAAARDGWGVFDAETYPDGILQARLWRIECCGTAAFADDHDAWEHVVAHARAGSQLHHAALAAVDDIERMLIEAACGAW